MGIGVLFPGQGAQRVGMGRSFYEKYLWVREFYTRASDIVGWDVAKLCFEGPKELLDRTDKSQVAIVVTTFAAWSVWQKEYDILPTAVAGLSLGEFSAILSAGVLDFEDTVRLVDLRGRLMQEASEEKPGAMSAVIGMEVSELKRIADEVGVELANFNAPGQIVISGLRDRIEEAEFLAKKAGAKRIVRLAVSGAFHCSLLSSAQEKLNKEIDKYKFSDPKFPIFSSIWGKKIASAEQIKQGLKKQLVSPTLWQVAIEEMSLEVKKFYEMAPAGVLKGLLRKICRDKVVELFDG